MMKFRAKRWWVLCIVFSFVLTCWTVGPVAAQDEPEAAAEEPADPFAVPDGSADELAEYMNGLKTRQIRSYEEFAKRNKAMLEVATKLLAADPNEQQFEQAVRIMIGLETDPKALDELAAKLTEDKKPELAREVRGASLKNQAIAAPAEKKKEVLAKVNDFLAEGTAGRVEAMLAMSVGRAMESGGDDELAAEAYTGFAKALADAKDPSVARYAEIFEGVARRLGLPGNPMKVEGTLLDGTAFDWPKYKGKVVLVDFWATWCGPCVAEVPNMKKVYEQYHDRGFEIVGISVDKNRAALDKFVEDREIPWIILHKEGEDNPIPTYYGVMGIPTMILVGADGNVVSIKARGPQLEKELEKLLGPPEAEEEAGSGAKE